MLKLFWVGHDHKKEIIVNQEESSSEWMWDEKEEVGQIALDVLENHESVYILAPVASRTPGYWYFGTWNNFEYFWHSK